MVGLAMRTDGLLGQKTYDPFNTGTTQLTTHAEISLTLDILASLKRFLTTARTPQRDAIYLVDTLLDAGRNMLARTAGNIKATAKMASASAELLDRIRKTALKALADSEMAKINGPLGQQAASTLLYQLHKDKYIPSSAMLLDQLIHNDGGLRSALDTIQKRESQYYHHAMKKIGLDVTMNRIK